MMLIENHKKENVSCHVELVEAEAKHAWGFRSQLDKSEESIKDASLWNHERNSTRSRKL